MVSSDDFLSPQREPPPSGNLRAMIAERPIPVLPRATATLVALEEYVEKQAQCELDQLDAALAANDADALQRCFFAEQAYWKDTLALTYHLRTFFSPSVIVANLLETWRLRGIQGRLELDSAVLTPVGPTLQFMDIWFSFKTESPGASCNGRAMLLPVKTDYQTLEWKVWVLSTTLESLDLHPEYESLLESPNTRTDDLEDFETDVFIIGGGNAAIALAARLKALGVESVIVERNARVGDNWGLRYDCLRLHVPTSFSELPYMTYPEELQSPHLLSRDDLAEHVRRYVSSFHLSYITSAKIQSTVYDQSTKLWTIKFQAPSGQRTAVSKQLVQATGIGSQKPKLPPIADQHLYGGINIHSRYYKNGSELKSQGVKSVIVVGSANTAFDILEDCHEAGLQVTMVARSPTYIFPLEYACCDASIGVYDHGVEVADRRFLTIPLVVEGQLVRGLFHALASKEPDRYAGLAEAGFPVVDSRDPSQILHIYLVDQGGGHYVDVGATQLIVDRKVGIKVGVEPVAFTKSGLCLSDDSTIDADAVIWCTGFADHNVRDFAAEILGGHDKSASLEEAGGDKNLLGPHDIAARLDDAWGVDSEGEMRGMWRRHLRVENYWVVGGGTQHHRWHSRTVALQIKAALEGILPPAYRETRGL